jgi:hypothetical protein
VIPAMEPSEMGEIKGVGMEQSGGRIGILFGRFTFPSVRVFPHKSAIKCYSRTISFQSLMGIAYCKFRAFLSLTVGLQR